MTSNEEVKKYLNSIKRQDRYIKALADEIRSLEIRANTFSGVGFDERVQSSTPLQARFTSYVDKAIDKSKELEKIMIQREKELVEAIRFIDSLESNLEKEILMYKYIEGYPFWKVANKLCMSKSQMYRLHDSAVNKLAIKWEKMGKNGK